MKKSDRQKHQQHHVLWASLTTAILVGIIILFNGGITGNTTIQPISYMKAGSQLHLEVKNIEGVDEILVKIESDVKNTTIKIDNVNTINWTFEGITLSKFKIFVEDPTKFGSITFLLRIAKNDLTKFKISENDVKIYQNNQELATKLFERSKDHLFYSAVAPSVGDFVIGKSTIQMIEIGEEKVTRKIIIPAQPQKEQPAPSAPEEEKGFFTRIAEFFRRLFW